MPNAPIAADSDQSHRTQIGQTLLALRKQQRLSVNALALKAGVSVGMISQIERDLANPSIKTLEKLAAALGVALGAFLDGTPATGSRTISPSTHALPHHSITPARNTAPDEAQFVRRLADRPTFDVGMAPLHKSLLSPVGGEGVRFMTIRMPAGSRSEDVVIGPGTKAGMVLEGTIQLTIDHHPYDLNTGDSFQFDAIRPHGIHNISDTEALVLWIMTAVPSITM